MSRNAIDVRPGGWPHREIGALAARQRGLVTSSQLQGFGLSTSAIGRSLRSGRLYGIHRGVYAVSHPTVLPTLAREQAALLACGPGAYLSHRTAAWVWGFAPDPGPPVDVTVVARAGGRSRTGIRIHRAATLDRADVRRHEGLPLTAPARTLLDLAPRLTREALEQAYAEAIKRNRMRHSEARAMVERHAGHPGVARLRALAFETRDVAWLKADTERRFLRLIRKAGLPQPETQADWGPYHQIDFLWREERVAVETDGYLFHSLPRDLENDHRRDAKLQAAGFIVLRFSWRQVRYQPELVLAEVAGVLAMRRAAA